MHHGPISHPNRATVKDVAICLILRNTYVYSKCANKIYILNTSLSIEHCIYIFTQGPCLYV